MTFSPLANMKRRISDHGRYNYRGDYDIQGIILHHNAGVDAYTEAENPARDVSANYWIANDGTIIPNIPEEWRAWTSASRAYPDSWYVDYSNITFEISNSPEGVRSGTWAISDAAYESVCKLIGDIFKRYDLGPVRYGQSDGISYHDDYVVTECPGPYIKGHINDIIARAEKYRTGKDPKPDPEPQPEPKPVIIVEEEDMKPTVHIREDKTYGFEATLGYPEFGLHLKPNEKEQIRSDKHVELRLGMYVTTDPDVAKAWARIWARGQGHETSRTNRDDYVEIQKNIQMVALEFKRLKEDDEETP